MGEVYEEEDGELGWALGDVEILEEAERAMVEERGVVFGWP